ncbi:hypothetical protein KP509_04G045000 [Ceratopteris richardii]|nr:hypothetical protein KP509_04G045000 [Ceratopteris richardii]
MSSTLKSSWMILRQKKTENEVSCWVNQLFIFMLFNCMLWVFYGLPINRPHNFWIILTNGIGSSLALIAIISFYCYTSRKQRLIVESELEAFFSFFLIMVLTTVMVNKDRERRVLIVGTIAGVLSSCMHFVLLVELCIAWKKNNLKRLQFIPSIAAFLKGALWTAYGWSGRDLFIVVPNGVGVATGVVQLILCLIIRYKDQKVDVAMLPEFRMSDKTAPAAEPQKFPMVDSKQNKTAFFIVWT